MAFDKRPFGERIDSLIRSVGVGKITAKCEVNQPYAQNQHQNLSFHHNDGRSHYLGGPLLENAYDLFAEIARGVITPFGSTLDQRMVNVAEQMARFVLENAPKDTGQLSLSGHPSVIDNGMVIYDRPPIAPREAD